MYNIETFGAVHTVSYIHNHTESSVRGTIRRRQDREALSFLQNVYIFFLVYWQTDSETTPTEEQTYKECQMCVVRVDLKTDGLHSEGMGAWEETYTTKGKPSISLSFWSEM